MDEKDNFDATPISIAELAEAPELVVSSLQMQFLLANAPRFISSSSTFDSYMVAKVAFEHDTSRSNG